MQPGLGNDDCSLHHEPSQGIVHIVHGTTIDGSRLEKKTRAAKPRDRQVEMANAASCFWLRDFLNFLKQHAHRVPLRDTRFLNCRKQHRAGLYNP